MTVSFHLAVIALGISMDLNQWDFYNVFFFFFSLGSETLHLWMMLCLDITPRIVASVLPSALG